MIKAVLFDMYRTLGEDVGHHSFLDTLLEHDIALSDARRIVRVADTDAFDGAEHYEHSVDQAAYDKWRYTHLMQALEDHGIPDDEAAVIAGKYNLWKSGFVSKFQPFPETRVVLEKLRADGYFVAVCSNWDWDIDSIIADLGITDTVDEVFSSARLGVRKPHKTFFERILEKIDATVHNSVFVGDMWNTDIYGATGVGMHAIWVDRLERTAPEERPDVTKVKDLNGVLEVVRTLDR